MIRKTPLHRYTPLKRTALIRNPSSIKKQSRIKNQSDKLSEALKVYYRIRLFYLEYFPECQIRLPGCTRKATEIHHMKGRGIWLCVIKFFLGTCRNCHDKVGDSKFAIAHGYSFRRNQTDELRPLQPFNNKIVIMLLNASYLEKIILKVY
jgi:hypothetical protein